jgi:hypothetical protein
VRAVPANPSAPLLRTVTPSSLLSWARRPKYGRYRAFSLTRAYEAGAVVVRQGEPGDELFLVLEGEAIVTVAIDGDSTVCTRARATPPGRTPAAPLRACAPLPEGGCARAERAPSDAAVCRARSCTEGTSSAKWARCVASRAARP